MNTMVRSKKSVAIMVSVLVLLSACTTLQYIHDPESLQREREIKRNRAGNIAAGTFLTIGSVVVAAFTGIYVSYVPEGTYLKMVTLDNKGSDTLQVNMLTDRMWKDSIYADFMNVRIPPDKKCRLLVPAGSAYNLYFSNTFDTTDDDEFIPLDTSEKRKVKLYPGLTFQTDTVPPGGKEW